MCWFCGLSKKFITEALMASNAEVLQAIAAEKAQVTAAINALTAQIQTLQSQLDDKDAQMAAERDAFKAAIENILV